MEKFITCRSRRKYTTCLKGRSRQSADRGRMRGTCLFWDVLGGVPLGSQARAGMSNSNQKSGVLVSPIGVSPKECVSSGSRGDGLARVFG